MRWGFRIVEDMVDGRQELDGRKRLPFRRFRGASASRVQGLEKPQSELQNRRPSTTRSASCDLCYVACWDGAHRCIRIDGAPTSDLVTATRASIASRPSPNSTLAPRQCAAAFTVDEDECVSLQFVLAGAIQVENCITMERRPRRARRILGAAMQALIRNWNRGYRHADAPGRHPDRRRAHRAVFPRSPSKASVRLTPQACCCSRAASAFITHLNMPFGSCTSSDDETGTAPLRFRLAPPLINFAVS